MKKRHENKTKISTKYNEIKQSQLNAMKNKNSRQRLFRNYSTSFFYDESELGPKHGVDLRFEISLKLAQTFTCEFNDKF